MMDTSSEHDATHDPVDEQAHNELLILIERYLRNRNVAPEAADNLRQQIDAMGIVPARIDYTGQEHSRSLEEYSRLIPGSGAELFDMAKRLSQVQNDVVPRWNLSNLSQLPLLASKKQNLLRTKEIVSAPTVSIISAVSSRPGAETIGNMHIMSRLATRELGGRMRPQLVLPESSIEKLQVTQCVLGHRSPIFCVAFDRSGQYLFTGADDGLVKVWDVEKGMLRFAFRGHDQEVADLSINHENTMLATGSSHDKSVRVSCLRTGETLAVLTDHTNQITIVRFLPYVNGNDRYLVTAARNGAIRFYKWNVETEMFGDTTTFLERDVPNHRIILISYCHSPGGSFVVFGDTCKNIRVFRITPASIMRLVVLTAHTDRIIGLEWANTGVKFVSGSRDGHAKVWVLENGHFKSTALIVDHANGNVSKKNAYRMTALCWTKDDSAIVTTGTDCLVRVWNWTTGHMTHVLRGHSGETYNLCTHPIFDNIIISAGYDGRIVVWDVRKGKMVTDVKGTNDSHMLLDMTVSPQGTRIAAVDVYGNLIVLGISEHKDTSAVVPGEQFFDSDYQELHYDEAGFVLDAGSGLPPHLMPPPKLIDDEGVPIEDKYQCMVPGRDFEGHHMDCDLPCAWLTRKLIPPLPSDVNQDENELRVVRRLEEDKQFFDTSGPEHIVCNDVPTAPRRPRSNPILSTSQLASTSGTNTLSNAFDDDDNSSDSDFVDQSRRHDLTGSQLRRSSRLHRSTDGSSRLQRSADGSSRLQRSTDDQNILRSRSQRRIIKPARFR